LIRPLHSGDEPTLEAFLRLHADSSMFLRSNARAEGLDYHGEPLQADYMAAFDGDRVIAVVAHCWNGMLLVQAPVDVEQVARAVVEHSGRPVTGLSGPAAQVDAARRALGLEHRPAPKHGQEELFALDLRDLIVPAPLADGRWSCRRPRENELDLVADWRLAFYAEALHRPDAPGLRDEAAEDIRLIHDRGMDWLLTDGDRPVAYSAFNARLPDIVQIGGVWTPPTLRGRGYGRTVVVGSLLDARNDGVTRAVLFAEREDAKRAYRGIGFRVVGEFGLVLFS
jgi:ribosomal protein S18 acetylase RimI-like enzyme